MTNSNLHQNFEKFKQSLPSAIAEKLETFIGREVASYLQATPNPDPDLAKLITPLSTIKSSEILKSDFPPIPWTVSGYLGPGLTFLFGAPKSGKSWLALQLALSVLKGGLMLSQEAIKGKVLYLALEDSKRRLKHRMEDQNWPLDADIDFMLYDKFIKQIVTLNSKGGKRLLTHIKTEGYNLVIIDTFSRSVHGNQLRADEMTSAIGPIQQYAMKHNLSLMIVDHKPKNGSSLFGSVAKQGVADTFWNLTRTSGKNNAILSISGRDFEKNHDLKLEFDGETHFWKNIGDANKLAKNEREQKIIEVLNMHGKVQIGVLVEVLGVHKGTIHHILKDLIDRGLVNRLPENKYVYYELS